MVTKYPFSSSIKHIKLFVLSFKSWKQRWVKMNNMESFIVLVPDIYLQIVAYIY